MNIRQNSDTSLVAESSTSEHDSVIGCAMVHKSVRTSDFPKEILGMKKTADQVRLGSLTVKETAPLNILPNKDVLKQLHKASVEDSARMLKAMNKELDSDLTKQGKVQLSELSSMVRDLNKEMETVEAVELDVSRESPWDIVKEGSSLRGLLESLKLKLETILTQKPELKDNKEHTIKMLQRGSGFEACHVQVAKGGELWEGVAGECSAVEEKNKAYFLRTESGEVPFHTAEKLIFAAEEFYKEKTGRTRNFNEMTTFSEGSHAVCLSNSGSCGKIMVSGEEEEEPNKSAKGEVAASISQVDADPFQSSFPDFSIRNFVSTARNKDIKSNWPFSRRSLKLCLNHGVKNILPPFQSLDSVQCLAESVLPAGRSGMDEKPLWLKNHPMSGSLYDGFEQKLALRNTDSNSSPSPSSIQDLASNISGHLQSEIESVSTSKIPLSDKQGGGVPPLRQKKQSASMFIPNKKRRVVVKLGSNMDHGTAEDITSTCTVPPPEAASQNTCPVCGIFSSSSNTTLNAHIDQCLLVEPNSECMKSSNNVKATSKPRKIRLMSDICATAPCCTLEDLDRRNGRVSIADAAFASPADKLSQYKIEKESFRHVQETGEDNAVYIDASGTKIRVLSKTNDALSIPKCAKELKVKKSLKTGKRTKLFASNKKHLAKNLKLSKAYIAKVSVHRKVKITAGTKQQEEELTPSFKFQEQNKVTDSQNCVLRTVLSENNHCKGKRGRRKCTALTTRDLSAESQQSCSANNSDRRDIQKSYAVKTGIDSVPNSMVVVGVKHQFPPQRKFMTSIPLVHSTGSKSDTAANQFSRENCCMPEASEASPIHSSPDKEVKIHACNIEKKDPSARAKANVSTGFHDPIEVTIGSTSGKSMRPSGQLCIVTSTCSGVEESRVHSWEVASAAEITDADAVLHIDQNELIGSVSSAELPTGTVAVSLSRSSNSELQRLTGSYGSESGLLQLAGSLFGTEPSIPVSRPCLGNMCQTFLETEGGMDTIGHHGKDSELEKSFPLDDSITIPGPPGSYLPSFRDSCFEYLQTSQDAPAIDKINSVSSASTNSGTRVANADLGASEKPPDVIAEKVFSGPLDERSGPPAYNAIMTVVARDEAENLGSDIESSKGDVTNQRKESSILRGGCTGKGGISWNDEVNVGRQRMMTTAVYGSHLDSNLKVEVEGRRGESSHSSYASTFGSSLSNDFSCTVWKCSSPLSGCDFGVWSPPPVLRLMGKDLMVLNNDECVTAKSQPSPNNSVGTQPPFISRMHSTHETSHLGGCI